MTDEIRDIEYKMSKINLTFGKSHSEVKWSDRREITLDQFAEILKRPGVGNKNGECYTPATFSGTARRMDQTVRIDVAVLDSDCGHNLIEIESALQRLGWVSIIHSTHSHMSDTTLIAAAPYEKWLTDNSGKGIADYLGEKKGYLPRVLKGAEIVDEMRDGNARNLIVRHQPCPKFRVLIPLDAPWLAEQFDSQMTANTRWRERIGALAHALDLHHDQSCVDTSRLFYLPRIKTADSPFEFSRTAGVPCPLLSLPDAPMAVSLFSAPQAAPAAPGAVQRPLQIVERQHTTLVDSTGVFVDLTAWAAEYAARFEVVTAIRARSPKILTSRRSGVKQHLICPNSGDHITSGAEATGTYAVNASEMPQAGLPSITSGFTVHCMHAGCAGHDRLDHLRAMLEQGTLTVDDLSDERFLVPQQAVDFSGFLAKIGRPIAPTARLRDAADMPPAGEKQPNIPPALYANLPGVMGDMHAYICATSPKPQPALALGAVLAFFGAAIGRKAEIAEFGLRANVYVICVAHSGAGKDRLLNAPKDLAQAAGLIQTLIGVEEVASDTGIVVSVMKQPNQVMLIDEISFLLAATHNVKAGVHVANVISTMLKLYSAAKSIFKGKSYADIEKVKTVNQPCVSILGCSTPAGLYSALSSKDVSNGLLSRFTLFDAGDYDPRSRAPSQIAKPQSVIDWLQAWDQRPLNQNPVEMEGGEMVIAPVIVPLTEEAKEISDAFEDEMQRAKVAARPHGTDALYVRGRENAMKFALIIACSNRAIKIGSKPEIEVGSLCVTGDIMRWACELSRVTITALELGVRENIVDSLYGGKLRDLSESIRKGGQRGMTKYEIARTKSGKMPDRELQDVIRSLIDAGDIFYVELASKTRGGRPRVAYVHKMFATDQEE